MNIIHTFEDFKRVSKEWNPILTEVNTIEEASDNINFPHEDYPEFVDNTLLALEETISILKRGYLVEGNIKTIHKICMEGKEIQIGVYRGGTVTVGGQLVPPQPYLIGTWMMSIMPVGTDYQKTLEDVIKWYKEFETIHPFEDGNGRVGGIVLAAMSFILTGKYTVSKREYFYYIDPMIKTIQDEKSVVLNKYFKGEYIDKVHDYLIAKMKSVKLQKIMELTNSREEFLELVEKKDIKLIVKFLNKIKTL